MSDQGCPEKDVAKALTTMLTKNNDRKVHAPNLMQVLPVVRVLNPGSQIYIPVQSFLFPKASHSNAAVTDTMKSISISLTSTKLLPTLAINRLSIVFSDNGTRVICNG